MGDQGNRARGRALVWASRALALAAAAATITLVAGIGAVQASPGDSSSASGTFLSGSLLQALTPAQIAELDYSSASNNGSQPTQTNTDPVDAGLLNSFGVAIAHGITVPMGIAQVGALGSYASAQPNGSSEGASGLVDNSGAIGVGTAAPSAQPGPLTIDLAQIVGPTLAAELADVQLQLGAMSASATSTQGAAPVGNYEIAGGKLLITSSTVQGITAKLNTAIGNLQTTANTSFASTAPQLLTAVQNVLKLVPGVTLPAGSQSASITANLAAGVTIPTTLTSSDGSVSINLSTGVITVDLSKLAGGLNGRAADTDILSTATLTYINGQVSSLITSLLSSVQTQLTTALQNATVSISTQANVTLALVNTPLVSVGVNGTIGQLLDTSPTAPAPSSLVTVNVLHTGISLAAVTPTAVLAAVRPLLTPLQTTLNTDVAATASGLQTSVATPVTTVTEPALSALTSIFDLTVNNQAPSPAVAGSPFTETALRMTLLRQGPVGSVMTLNVATGAVGVDQVGQLPTITSITPTHGPVTGGTVVDIMGTHLSGTQSVTFGGTYAGTSVTVLSDTELTVVTPPHVAGAVGVVVTNLTGSSTAGSFTYDPILTLTSVSPPAGTTAGGTTVDVFGTCLTTATGVTFGGVAGTGLTHISDAEVSVVTPVHAAGLVAVAVTTTGVCAGTVTLTSGYTFVTPLPATPLISSITPVVGPETGGTIETITGSGFTGATAVTFDGAPGTSFAVNSATQITVTTPPHVPAIVPVVVVGASANSPAGLFTYTPVIRLTGITPAIGPTAGGQAVTITGSCFTGATGATIGGNPLTSFAVVSDTTITGVTPAGSGVADVHVQGSAACGGGYTLAGLYTYLAPAGPVVLSLSPIHGPAAGGTTVQLLGTGLTGTTGVTFGGTAATLVSVTDTAVTVTTAAHAPGLVDVVLQNPNNNVPISGAYTYDPLPIPVAVAITPVLGPTAGGQAVSIVGSGFTGATGVTFGGTAATGVTVVDDTHITATTPAHAAGLVDVVVDHPSGNALPLAYTYVAPPVPLPLTLLPISGPIAGGTLVTITGTTLGGTTGVDFGGVAGTLGTVTATSVQVTTPAHVAGAVDVVLHDPAGNSTLPLAFTFVAPLAPSVTTIVPDVGPTAGGTVVTLTGTNLQDATGVTFDGVAGTSVVVTPTSVIVTTPVHTAPGPVDVGIVDPDGAYTAHNGFTYVAPILPPASLTLLPLTGPTAGGTMVTITGANLQNTSSVTFDGVAGTNLTNVTATSVTVTTPAHVAGLVAVNVTTPGGSALVPGGFTYLIPAPTITQITPVSGTTLGGTTVTISGTNLDSVTAVDFGVDVGTGIVHTNSASIQVTTPAHAQGPVDVTLVSVAGIPSLTNGYTYITPPAAPTLSGILPVSGPVAGGTTVTIAGSHLTGTTAVTFGGVAATAVTVISDNQLTAVTPAHAAGTVTVAVTGPGGTTSLVNAYSFVTGPTLTSLTPTSGTTLGGTAVTLTGTNLNGATSVTFGGTAGTALTVVSPTEVIVTTPAHLPGTVDVTITTPGGPSTLTGAFTYLTPPSLQGVTPNTGPVAGGTTVTLTGSNLGSATGVTFGGVAATSLTVISPTTLVVVTPAHAAGPVDVAVQYPGGTSVLTGAYTYLGVVVPTVISVSPITGPAAGGSMVTIVGTGFTGATGVTFGGVPGTLVAVAATSIEVMTPAHAPGPVDVTVETPAGNLTEVAAYSYEADPGGSGGGSGPSLGSTGSGDLAVTGTTSEPWLIGALAALFAGAALVTRRARRRLGN